MGQNAKPVHDGKAAPEVIGAGDAVGRVATGAGVGKTLVVAAVIVCSAPSGDGTGGTVGVFGNTTMDCVGAGE